MPTTRFYPVARPDLRGNEERYLREAIRETAISSVGRRVHDFEAACARALGVRRGVAVSHGTAAVHLALRALRIGPGDEVIIPDLTYVATANTVAYTGAKPLLVDVDPSTWTIDPAAVERAISKRTKAIIAVHLYGNPADLDALTAIARAHRIALIEDAAQAFGATWRGRAVGAIGDVGCYSFYGNKIITTGEGGACVARTAAMDQRLRRLRDQAMSLKRRYFHTEIAFNYRLSALQAAVGLAQVERLPRFLAKRAQIADWYRAALRNIDDLSEPRPLVHARPVNWLFTVRVGRWTQASRDRGMAALRARGVDTRPVLVPMSRLPMYRRRPLPVSDDIAAKSISLPTYTQMTRRDVDAIASAFRAVLARPARRRRRG